MVRKIVVLALIIVVFSAGCLGQAGTKNTSQEFSLKVTSVPFRVPINVTAITVNVSADFIGYRHLVIDYSYLVVFVKTDSAVFNVSAFRLSNDVYMVPYYQFKDSHGLPASITVWMKNGSTAFVNINVSGTPKRVVNMVVNYEVDKNGTYYVVRPLGWSVKRLNLWNETFNVTVELNEPIQMVNAPPVKLINNTYILPSACKVTNGSTTAVYKYSVGDVYIVGSVGEGFVGKIYFPCEKMEGK
ncbi:hypothetical protein [Thermococcus sp. 5-4]|uniref:hypothetical protein n=1 Tax=Thermococcus sp. 5-4 TaxID=2008440 RepID=UPI000B49FFB3|nr:hypothetical protein [Thermococcus sp. 5-4]ASA77366.1 hypothetical protein CDI07_03350 [Thermococcus sp. 5-4]